MAKRRRRLTRAAYRARNASQGKPKHLMNRYTGGPAGHREAVKALNDEERILKRRADAYRLFKDESLTFTEIGKKLGVSNKTAWEDVNAYRQVIQHEFAVDGDMIRHRILANLRHIYRTHSKKTASAASAKVMLDSLAQERKLLGVDLSDTTSTYTGEQVMGVIQAICRLFMELVADQDLRLQFATGVRRKVKLEMRSAIPIPGVVVSSNGHPQPAAGEK